MKRIGLRALLLLLLLPLFLLMGGALFATGLGHTRDFLQRQLGNHAQDAATALALRLAPAFAANDRATVASTVDALFDSGYFRTIVLMDPRGDLVLTRSEPVRVDAVPAWFVDLLPLATPEGTAEVSTGWTRVAEVRVASHPGHAYTQLWHSARATLLWALGFCLAAAALLVWALGHALRPLAAMERLALGVAEGRFERQAGGSRIRELDHIGQALDRMSAAVERMLADKAQLIERLRDELHHDPATGLANRAYFQSVLETTLDAGESRNGLVLLQVSGLEGVNVRQGWAAGDRLVMATGLAVAGIARRQDALAARLNGSQFALLLEACDRETVMAAAAALVGAVQQTVQAYGMDAACAVHAGSALGAAGGAAALLAGADAALRDARLGPSGSCRHGSEHAPGREAVRRLLREALREGRLELAWQPLLRCADNSLEHREAFARLDDGAGGMLPAGGFVALADEEGLAADLDRRIVTQAWAALAAAPNRVGSVNLSPTSLAQPDFVDWLANLVAEPSRLYLECSLARVAASPAVADALVGLKRRGFGLTLDRFVPGTSGLEWMATLRPDWVKLESGLCRHAVDHAGTRVLLRSLCEYARELGVRVAATGVERQADLALLCGLGMDAAQGRACDAACPV
jgi:predicted signal transduction protein with EAL and GGDEF domain